MKSPKTTIVAGLLVFGCCIAMAEEGGESSAPELVLLLEEARGELAREQAESARLEHLFETQEAQLAAAQAELDEWLGVLKVFFGVLQTVAEDTRARFSSSLTNLQFPDREAFLVEFASDTMLASINDVEHLSYELLRDIAESGRVVRFQAVVTKANGEQSKESVVRVGTFNVVSDAGYLGVTPDGRLEVLARQPDSRFTDSAKNMANATGGVVVFGLDVARGGTLGLLQETGTSLER